MSFYCKGIKEVPIIGDIEIDNIAKNAEKEIREAEKRIRSKKGNSTKIKDTLEFKEKEALVYLKKDLEKAQELELQIVNTDRTSVEIILNLIKKRLKIEI